MQKHTWLMEIIRIDEKTADHLVEQGYDSLEKLADASEEDLNKIPGLSNHQIAEIRDQARQMQDEKDEETLSELVEDTTRLKDDVEKLVRHIRRRFDDDNAKEKQRRALRKETSRTLASLEKVEASLSDQLRRLGKGLAKADAKLMSVSNGDVEDVTAGLKKARKKIEKVID